MKTAKKINFIINQLSSVTHKAFYMKAPKETSFPYIVFNFPSNNPSNSNAEDRILELDVWNQDKPNYDALTETENLTDQVENIFKTLRHLDEESLFIFTKLNRFSLPDEDTSIERRQLRFLIKNYDRN
ncbi:hypothetical protein ACH0BF_02155 [Pseudobacillus sp. 179-B 2D1 NHS]|uniref:tail completion protein gp17 n=1 Tax=Pseudobacillus sp. 179-B 2D1 NHS TaxID=3374292 RepID=UPI0038794CCC